MLTTVEGMDRSQGRGHESADVRDLHNRCESTWESNHTYTNNKHARTRTCITCHMHNMHMTYWSYLADASSAMLRLRLLRLRLCVVRQTRVTTVCCAPDGRHRYGITRGSTAHIGSDLTDTQPPLVQACYTTAFQLSSKEGEQHNKGIHRQGIHRQGKQQI